MDIVTLEHFSIDSVAGTVPGKIVDSKESLSRLVGEAKAASIAAATGFATRRVVDGGLGVEELALDAAKKALRGMDASRLGGVIAVTFSKRRRFPALSIDLHRKLGLPADAPAFDIDMACSGYPYGLMAAGQLSAALSKPVLLVDGDAQSLFLGGSDPGTLAVMGDAATATIVSAGRDAPPARFAFLTRGDDGAALGCHQSGPITMDGFAVFKFVASDVTGFLKGFIAETGADIDVFAPHLANVYMARQLAKSLGLEDRLATCEKCGAGNPGSASSALALATMEARKGAFTALVSGFGAGLGASAALVSVSPDACAGGGEYGIISCHGTPPRQH